MQTELINPNPGLAVARYLKMLARNEHNPQIADKAAEDGAVRSEFGSTPSVFRLLEKGATAANQQSDSTVMNLAQALYSEWLPLLRARTVVDRVQGWRRVPMNASVLRFTSDATSAVVVEGAAVPVGKVNMERIVLSPAKYGGIIVVTKETLLDPAQNGESAVASELAKSIGTAVDRAMFNIDVTGSIANSGTMITSAGSSLANIDSDLQLMLATFANSEAALDEAIFIMAPGTAGYLASLRGSGGARAFPDISVRTGGNLLGVPVFISNALKDLGSPGNSSISLVAPSRVLLADPGAVEVRTSESASIQMDGAPSESSTTPTATSVVSMWQTNCVAILGLRWINFKLAAAADCVTLKNVGF